MLSTDFKSLLQDHPVPQWDHTPEELIEIAEDVIVKEKQINDYIASIKEPTVENTLRPYANYENQASIRPSIVGFYSSVSPDKNLRDASHKAREIMIEKGVDEDFRQDVFKVFKKLYEKVKDADESVIDDESKRYLEKIVKESIRDGLDLPDEQIIQVKKLKVELSNLQHTFSKNLNEQNEFLLFTLDDLDGVPQDVIDSFEKVQVGEVEKVKMTFNYPDYFPVMKYARNQQTRKIAYLSYQNKIPENAALLSKIIELRLKKAKLLGFDTFSELALQDRLAKNQKTVLAFLDDLKSKLTPLGKAELANMLEFKKKDLKARGLPQQDEYYSWDSDFYSNLLLEQEYKVDHVKIAEYFPLGQTIERMLGFYEHLFDIKFIKVEKPDPKSLWCEDVQRYAVFLNIKNNSPEFTGWISIDLFPREGKYSHAANFPIGSGYIKPDGSRQPPYTVLVCNFTKPTAEKPSLLKHKEVVTFFHELGHGIHNLLSKTQYLRFHGTAVPRDFVETPSQMLEFWTWSKDELKQLSSHYETGEPISDELIDQLIKSKSVNGALANLRQLHFGSFDMKVHTVSTQDQVDELNLPTLWNDSIQNIGLLSNGGQETKGYASFGHIGSGYESSYYGYLFSKVYAVDIYYSLFKKDPMNAENGIRYRDIVLKRGGSKDIMEILTELLGRAPNSEAFTQEILSS